MPLHRRTDSVGTYFIWGNHGKRYYYKPGNKRSREIAREKAMKQGRAIEWSKYSRK